MSKCPTVIGDFEFPLEDITRAVRERRLLSMEIEFSQKCNFRCPYCYVASESGSLGEMTVEESRDVIQQAVDLGARKIIVLGGEPMIYPRIREMIQFMRGKGLTVEMFTNGSGMTAEAARFMFEQSVRVVLKMNSRDGAIQDLMAGKDGAHRIIADALANLRAAGYPTGEKVLAISTIISRKNEDELVEMWTWLREQNIEPYFEMITPQGRSRQNEWLYPDLEKTRQVFEAIAEIDRTRFGREWDPQPPLVGNRCLRHQFSVFVNTFGDVMPCVGVTIRVGNVREKKLREIIEDSEVIQDLRHYRGLVKGPCGQCDKADRCYGCRGAAYQMTGDYMGSDPLCWLNTGRQSEIRALPMAVEDLIPQKAPMRIVDRLLSVGERTAVAELVVPVESPFVDEAGGLDEAAYVEIVAQATAAMNCFRTKRNGREQEGFLLGTKDFRILGKARSGDRLTISLFKQTKFGDFGIVEGTVSRNGDVLAKGEVKIWHKAEEVAHAAL
jgi:radical SAM protein with 4Fe4S-binding SPASM domain